MKVAIVAGPPRTGLERLNGRWRLIGCALALGAVIRVMCWLASVNQRENRKENKHVFVGLVAIENVERFLGQTESRREIGQTQKVAVAGQKNIGACPQG
jgi:hypothetical protein